MKKIITASLLMLSTALSGHALSSEKNWDGIKKIGKDYEGNETVGDQERKEAVKKALVIIYTKVPTIDTDTVYNAFTKKYKKKIMDNDLKGTPIRIISDMTKDKIKLLDKDGNPILNKEGKVCMGYPVLKPENFPKGISQYEVVNMMRVLDEDISIDENFRYCKITVGEENIKVFKKEAFVRALQLILDHSDEKERTLMEYTFVTNLGQCVKEAGNLACSTGVFGRIFQALEGYIPGIQLTLVIPSTEDFFAGYIEYDFNPRVQEGSIDPNDKSYNPLYGFYIMETIDEGFGPDKFEIKFTEEETCIYKKIREVYGIEEKIEEVKSYVRQNLFDALFEKYKKEWMKISSLTNEDGEEWAQNYNKESTLKKSIFTHKFIELGGDWKIKTFFVNLNKRAKKEEIKSNIYLVAGDESLKIPSIHAYSPDSIRPLAIQLTPKSFSIFPDQLIMSFNTNEIGNLDFFISFESSDTQQNLFRPHRYVDKSPPTFSSNPHYYSQHTIEGRVYDIDGIPFSFEDSEDDNVKTLFKTDICIHSNNTLQDIVCSPLNMKLSTNDVPLGLTKGVYSTVLYKNSNNFNLKDGAFTYHWLLGKKDFEAMGCILDSSELKTAYDLLYILEGSKFKNTSEFKEFKKLVTCQSSLEEIVIENDNIFENPKIEEIIIQKDDIIENTKVEEIVIQKDDIIENTKVEEIVIQNDDIIENPKIEEIIIKKDDIIELVDNNVKIKLEFDPIIYSELYPGIKSEVKNHPGMTLIDYATWHFKTFNYSCNFSPSAYIKKYPGLLEEVKNHPGMTIIDYATWHFKTFKYPHNSK